MLTHGNFMFELGVAVDELGELFDTEDASTLLFLPLAHVFARIIQVGCVKSRARMGHSADIKNLVADLGEFRPTFILAVPRVFEKVFNTASQRATADGRGQDLRPRRRRGHRVVARARRQAGAGAPARPARPLRQAGLRQAPRRRWAAAARTPSPAARRWASGSATSTAASASRPRGLRPDRDHRGAVRQPPRRARRSAPSAAPSRHQRPGRRRRRAALQGRSGLRRLLGQRGRDQRGASTATAGSTPATSARSTTRASSGSPAARRRSW